jgi:hypothetical protein
MKHYKVTAFCLNVREDSSIHSKVIGFVRKNDVVFINTVYHP